MLNKFDNLFRYISENFMRTRCLDCGELNPDGEHNGNHTIANEIRLSLKEWQKLQDHFKAGWEENMECPVCGAKADPEIKACETGLNYCSSEHAKQHVKANEPEGGY